MWLIGTLCILAGAEMVFRARESYIASEFLRQYRRLYEHFYDSDVMIDLAFLLLVLLSWLFVWAAASKWLSAAVRSMLCVVGCSVSLYVCYRMRHYVRKLQRRFVKALYAGLFNRWIGVAFILLGVLFIASDIAACSSGHLSNRR